LRRAFESITSPTAGTHANGQIARTFQMNSMMIANIETTSTLAIHGLPLRPIVTIL
jgi:hypothetical protein